MPDRLSCGQVTFPGPQSVREVGGRLLLPLGRSHLSLAAEGHWAAQGCGKRSKSQGSQNPSKMLKDPEF